MHPSWQLLHKNATPEHLGFLPQFLNENDPDDAQTQLNKNYAYGGGFNEFEGFKVSDDLMTIRYPGDPPYHALAMTKLRDETIVMFPHAWVLVHKADGTNAIARMD